LRIQRPRGLADCTQRIANKNLSVGGRYTGHKVLELSKTTCGVSESGLPAAAIEGAARANARMAVLDAKLHVVFALQVRQPVDELEDVVRPVILGEAGTAANGAEPA